METQETWPRICERSAARSLFCHPSAFDLCGLIPPMQNIIVEKPYRFVPPYPGEFWTRLFRYYLPRYLNKTWGIATAQIRGIEFLKASIRDRHTVLLAPTHSRPG